MSANDKARDSANFVNPPFVPRSTEGIPNIVRNLNLIYKENTNIENYGLSSGEPNKLFNTYASEAADMNRTPRRPQ